MSGVFEMPVLLAIFVLSLTMALRFGPFGTNRR